MDFNRKFKYQIQIIKSLVFDAFLDSWVVLVGKWSLLREEKSEVDLVLVSSLL